jgi:hypothetical protein
LADQTLDLTRPTPDERVWLQDRGLDTLGRRLSLARYRAGMPLVALQAQFGVSRATIYAWERGHYPGHHERTNGGKYAHSAAKGRARLLAYWEAKGYTFGDRK